MVTKTAKDFLTLTGTIFDVRSPSEYSQGHIPGAVNLPLFSDEEREQVGKVYVNEGQEKAVSLGWKLVTPKVFSFIEQIEKHMDGGVAKVHCWRGGMRSQSLAELFRLCGIETVVLKGGYKSFRQWCNTLFSKKYSYRVLGGLTGCGKTKTLHALEKMGEQVIDLEGLANHRGSAFGTVSQQPSTEHFHNLIACELSCFDQKKPVWIEDESRTIGTCHLPETLFESMRLSPLFVIERSLENRLHNLNEEYGRDESETFISGVLKIQRKLGGSQTKEVIDHLQNGRKREAAELVLRYYDKAYLYDLSQRQQEIQRFNLDTLTDEQAAEQLKTSK